MRRDDSMHGELANEIDALFIALGILPGFLKADKHNITVSFFENRS